MSQQVNHDQKINYNHLNIHSNNISIPNNLNMNVISPNSANTLHLICHSEESARERCETQTDFRPGHIEALPCKQIESFATSRANPILVKGLNNLKEKFKKYMITMAIREKIFEKEKQDLQNEVKSLKDRQMNKSSSQVFNYNVKKQPQKPTKRLLQ